MQELHRVVNMPKYGQGRQGSEYVSYNTQREVTLQVNVYLLRGGRNQNPVKGLRWSTLDK